MDYFQILGYIPYICPMNVTLHGKVRKSDARHTPGVSQQTGFPSPATHYLEPTINLHQELVSNSDATFFVRIEGDALVEFNIQNEDVLIIDRSVRPRANQLVLVAQDGEFKVMRIPDSGLQDAVLLWGTITYIIHAAR